MNHAKSITFILPIILFICGCGGDSPGKGPADVFFAYGNGDGIYALSADGTLNKKVIGGYYYQAVLSPDKTKIACVYDKDFHITIFNLDGNFESQGRPKIVYNPQALPLDSKLTAVYCPVWSLDSQKLYFLNLNRLIVYDYQDKKTDSLFDFPENQSGGQTDDQGSMKLSKDGDSLYCMLSEGTDKLAFWTINLSSNQGTQVAETNHDLLSDFKFPPEMPEDVVESLFGSRENPVLGPAYSSDHRYFFYFQKDQGFLAKQRIEGYDTVTKEKFDVATLGISLYSN